jgi:lycopene cyclase domain-containing protein
VSFGYLAALLTSLAGLTLLDVRFKLAFFNRPIRSLVTIAVPYFFFVTWDLTGIEGGIFFRGESLHVVGISVFNEFPIEELFFLAVLCYTALIGYAALERARK